MLLILFERVECIFTQYFVTRIRCVTDYYRTNNDEDRRRNEDQWRVGKKRLVKNTDVDDTDGIRVDVHYEFGGFLDGHLFPYE